MPDIFKIGRTERNVEDRIKPLDTTSMPAPFRCVYAAEVNDVVIVEKRIHKIFIDKRIGCKIVKRSLLQCNDFNFYEPG